jgi:hypothetical protein
VEASCPIAVRLNVMFDHSAGILRRDSTGMAFPMTRNSSRLRSGADLRADSHRIAIDEIPLVLSLAGPAADTFIQPVSVDQQ